MGRSCRFWLTIRKHYLKIRTTVIILLVIRKMKFKMPDTNNILLLILAKLFKSASIIFGERCESKNSHLSLVEVTVL